MKTKIMGILNVTPDSYFDHYETAEQATKRAQIMIEQGADIIDIGAESTRPFSQPISKEKELKRLKTFFDYSSPSYPFSIDTYKPEVAAYAIDHGALMINDISGFENDHMCEIAASSGVEVCIMHKEGTAKTRHLTTTKNENICEEIKGFFLERIEKLVQFGVREEKIILDPGIGFGKDNPAIFAIFKGIPDLLSLGFPLLIGASRKSFLQRELHKKAEETLAATLVMNTIAAYSGAAYLRVHDVKEHKDLAHLVDTTKS